VQPAAARTEGGGVIHRFHYERPRNLAQAAALLAGAQGAARVLAGGTDLLVALRAGAARPELVVDVKALPGLAEIAWKGARDHAGDLVLGACVAVQRIADDARIRAAYPALAEGAEAIGSIQVRERATLGGNLANASPCMDTAPPLLVLGARVRIASARGERELPLAEFFRGVKQTALAADELLTAIVVPAGAARLRTAFDKVKRIEGHDLALVNAAAALDPKTNTLQVAIGSCGPTPILAPAVSCDGVTGDGRGAEAEAAGDRLAAVALERIRPIDDVRASAEYRRDMTALLCRRLAARLLGPTGGGSARDARGRS
jgi:carbon-monoxide dehydrogenase medium subunit